MQTNNNSGWVNSTPTTDKIGIVSDLVPYSNYRFVVRPLVKVNGHSSFGVASEDIKMSTKESSKIISINTAVFLSQSRIIFMFSFIMSF